MIQIHHILQSYKSRSLIADSTLQSPPISLSSVCHFGNCREQLTLVCNQRNGMAFLDGG
jgi:hypothetical protein